ncbi:MAG: TonB-dependent receptor [Paludibacteraceae bacterium]|nr:TonB-dependent receptor [Paludibacteraceae bacterium]
MRAQNTEHRAQTVFLLGVITLSMSAFAQTSEDTLTILMHQLEDIEVSAKRVQQTTLSTAAVKNEELNRDNTGQNLPYLLSTTPGLQVTSDDGLGVGYTYFRVRGTDHTRINMTVNEVQLNDQESQTVFWVNMSDMASSISQIDVQRGVGTSTSGSAFGAGLNMQTNFLDSTSHIQLAFNGGMYNTFREMVSAHAAIANRWMINARFSKVNSDGFLYRTKSDLYSYYGDIGWYGKKTQVILRAFGGAEKTGMGWEGVSYDVAYGIHGADRRYNPAGEYTVPASDGSDSIVYYKNQTDNYAQQHAQLAINHRFTPQWSLTATLHYTHGGGYYEQYKKKKYSYWGLTDPALVTNPKDKSYGLYMKHLNNHYAGFIVSGKYLSEAADLQLGVAGNNYYGQHWGVLDYLAKPTLLPLPIHYEYYRNDANKIDVNTYAKANWRIIHKAQEKLALYADLQYRYVRYSMDGINDETMTELPLVRQFHFFNPKAGLTYQNQGHLLSASFAMANRDPSRSNYTENLLHDTATGTYEGVMPQAETLYDYELGYAYAHTRFNIGVNLYFMDYDNQLVLTGEYNDVGKYLTTNVKDSYRMGAELMASVRITDWFRWEGNMVVSRNKILNYKQYIDVYDNANDWNWIGQDSVCGTVTIAFSPTITAMSMFTFDYAGFIGTIQTNVVSRQYMDNTMDEHAMLKAYTTTNVNLQYRLPMQKWFSTRRGVPNVKLLCQLNNIFNAKYAGHGGSEASRFADGSRLTWYYAQAGINVHGGFVVQW